MHKAYAKWSCRGRWTTSKLVDSIDFLVFSIWSWIARQGSTILFHLVQSPFTLKTILFSVYFERKKSFIWNLINFLKIFYFCFNTTINLSLSLVFIVNKHCNIVIETYFALYVNLKTRILKLSWVHTWVWLKLIPNFFYLVIKFELIKFKSKINNLKINFLLWLI